MNECHTNFVSSKKLLFQMCFQVVHEMYELWMNEFCTISIIKSWNVNFMISMLRLGCIIGERFKTIEEYLDVENNILEENKKIDYKFWPFWRLNNYEINFI